MDRELLKDMTEAFGPPGFEDEVAKVIQKHGKGMILKSDAMYNVFATLEENTENKPVVQLDAHSDEVGFMVQSITSKGLLKLAPLGGWIGSNLPAHTVLVRNAEGQKNRGIIVSKPPHFMKEEERRSLPVVEELMVDIGAMSKERALVEFGIQIGDPVALEVGFEERKDGLLFGKAFDNRLGCVCILETLRRLKEKGENLRVHPVGAFAAQEEVGLRGAQVTGSLVGADLAIVFEGSPADDLYFEEGEAQCALGKGVQIRCKDASYVSSPSFLQLAGKIAREKGIPHQFAVRYQGSTNAGKIHLANKAVPALVLGVPSRFVHTHYNYAMKQDLEAAVDLAVEVIQALEEGSIQSLLQPAGF